MCWQLTWKDERAAGRRFVADCVPVSIEVKLCVSKQVQSLSSRDDSVLWFLFCIIWSSYTPVSSLFFVRAVLVSPVAAPSSLLCALVFYNLPECACSCAPLCAVATAEIMFSVQLGVFDSYRKSPLTPVEAPHPHPTPPQPSRPNLHHHLKTSSPDLFDLSDQFQLKKILYLFICFNFIAK